MAAVREVALQADYLVRAVEAHRWRPAELPNGRVWWTMTSDLEAEVAWLRGAVYGREAEVPVHPITARERFSDRTWDFGQ